jgi:hypothetical protein
MEAQDYLLLADWTDIIHIVIMIGYFFCYAGFLSPKTKWIGNLAIALIISTVLSWFFFGNCPLEILSDNLRLLGGANEDSIKDPFIVSKAREWFNLTIQDGQVVIVGICLALFSTVYLFTHAFVKNINNK